VPAHPPITPSPPLSVSAPPSLPLCNVGKLETPMLPSLDGRGWGRVETSGIPHPHPTSPVEGEEPNSAALTSPVEGEEFKSPALPPLSPSHTGLILVGTVHADPKGFARTLCLLQSLKPELVFVELSPFGKTYRIDNQSLLQRSFNRNVKHAARKCGLALKHALTHPEIKAVRRQLTLPFEYRAACRYGRDSGTDWILVDSSPFSRKMISTWVEMITRENLASLLSLPRDNRLDIAVVYDHAARIMLKESTPVIRASEMENPETRSHWKQREHRMAGTISRALHTRRPTRAVYLGGWEHLTLGLHFTSLRKLLAVGLDRCYLLDRGFL